MRYMATSLALVVWLAFMMSVTLGMGAGYSVDSPSEIPAEFDKAEAEASTEEMDCSAESRYGPAVAPIAEKINSVFGIEQTDECSETAVAISDSAVSVALSVAEKVAYMGYYLSLVVPSQIMDGALILLTFLPAGGLTLKLFSDMRAFAT